MAPGRQAPDCPLGSTRSAASRVPSAPRLRLQLRLRPLRAGARWAARLAACRRVAMAEAGASEAVAVVRRRGSRGGSGGGGGCTGGGGQGSITHLHTHRGRSLDSSKPRHGADTLSSLDLAGASPALLCSRTPSCCQNQLMGAVAKLRTQTHPRTHRRLQGHRMGSRGTRM